MRTSILPATFVAVLFVLSVPSAVLAVPDCTYWTEKDGVGWKAVSVFWKAATPDDVTRCLKAGANPKARTKQGKRPIDLADENSKLTGPTYWKLHDVSFD